MLTIICFNTTHTLHGTVIKSTGSWYLVRTDEGECVECKVKGNFRLRGIRVIQMFYNIIVSKPFADHYGIKTQDRNRPIEELLAAKNKEIMTV